MDSIGLDYWHLWMILAVVLFTAEIFVPGFVLAGLGFAAFFAGISHFFIDSTGWALIVYSVAAMVFFVGIRPFALRTFMDAKPSPFGVNAMVGQQITVKEGKEPGADLHAIFRDTQWSIASKDELQAGDSARIVAVKSTTLVVEKI